MLGQNFTILKIYKKLEHLRKLLGQEGSQQIPESKKIVRQKVLIKPENEENGWYIYDCAIKWMYINVGFQFIK